MGRLKPAVVNPLRHSEKYSFLEVTITEGRNRQVRRMIEAIGSKVMKLTRVAIGPIRIGDLQIGMHRELTAGWNSRQPPPSKKPLPVWSRALLSAGFDDSLLVTVEL